MYVARYTFDPKYDARRRWTGYISPQGETPEALAEKLLDLRMVTLPQRLWDAWEMGQRDEAIAYVLEHEDIRYHEGAEQWLLVHNPRGLSCWPLEAETVEEAIAEARALDADGRIEWCGWGHVTIGDVRHVAAVSDTLHIFAVDDTMREC